MGDDSLILREDGYIRMNFPVTSLTYHSNLNIILVKTDVGGVHVLDVNSGVILQSSCLSADDGGTLGVEYAGGADRVFVWDSSGVGARTDYNGVLLLHTALQRPLPSSQPDKIIRIELVLSEAVLLYQCLQSLDAHSIEGLTDFINELKNSIDAEPVRKGVKAQKWSTVTICLPHSTLRLVTTGVVQELKGQNRRIPALAIASAVGQRANELVPMSRDEESRPLMYSEAERKETFKRWPHMDYKWALPARMAQAGFYHQPSPSGDDRAMCFTCLVCLVCWEKSDEPWVEHERHSPNCPFVRGEYTHNVPISVTNATACAVPCTNVTVVSKGNTGDLIATGTPEGKVNIWRFDCGLKLVKFIHLSPYDSIFSGMLATDSNKVWSASLEKDSSTYGVELTAMAFVGMTSQQEAYPQTQNTESTEKETNTNKTKPSLICAVIITRTNSAQTDQPIKEDSSKALFDSGADKESVQAMNDQNEAKNNLTTNKMLFLLTYDIHSSLAGSITTVVHTSNSSGNSKPGGSKKVCTVARPDDANIYDEIYFQYSDEDTELPQCTNSLLDEQISNVINLNASSSKEDCKMWEPKKIILPKHFKVMPPPPPTALLPELQEAGQATMLDFVGKISQLKSWKSGNLESVGTKLADQTDAVLQQADPITHYLNMNGPLEISDLKWYEGGDGTEKVKVTTFGGGSKVGTQTAITNSNNDGFDSDPPQEEAVSQGIAVQCLSLPPKLNFKDDAKVTHLLPTEDKEHLLVVISSIEPEKVKVEEETDNDGDTKMEVDEVTEPSDKPKSDAKAFFLLYKINNKTSIYTLDDHPVSYKELPFNESPVDLCLLPTDKHDQYSFAAVGVDGSLRLYSLPDFKTLSEKRVPKGQFTSVVFCASVERLSVSTKHGMIYFYALNNGEKDNTGDIDEDEFANIDFDMLQRAPRDEVCGPSPAPVIIANKTELDLSDLETLIYLTGYYGTNTTVPYSAVVPGFWCELSPAQRSRSDHQNNRTWRLQNTSSTWDEHVLELTLPYSVSLAHIEFGFTLHSACSANLPIILVTLLKQNLHGIGYKKDASFGHRSDSPIHFPVIDADMSNLENPVNSEEYLQAHNAEILAGPLLLSSGLDMTQQSGTLILTSPRLYRARGRTFLIHIKTLFDPAKDMSKGTNKTGESSSKKTGFIGCDWLHQISLTVRSSPHTDVAMERQQRIAMLESNSFLNTLCEISINNADLEMRNIAMDLLIWVVSIRLQRMRLAKTEKGKDKTVETQQLECVKIIEKHTDALIKNCILCASRSMAKKCVKILLITSEGEKQLPKPWKSTFEATLSNSVCACIPYVGASVSAGAVRWLAALAQQCTARAMAPALVAKCLALLERAAKCLRDRPDVYHSLLRARFGLYGLPLERTIFATEIPELGRGTSTPVTYASVLAGDTTTPPVPKPDYQLKELLNLPLDMDAKSATSSTAWWAQNNGVGVFGAGLSEAMPLHVTCHVASDGTKLESSGARHHSAVVSSMPGAGPGDPSQQLWSVVKEGQMKQSSQDPDSLEDVESSLMECDPQEKMEFSEEKLFKDQEQCGIPWASLVTRPPQHTLVVERMHSGARRYIVLDFGHPVRLTDVIIPSCSDLVTLCIDLWVTGEETDCVKLAFATDIATKHLVLTDIQPAPICRYMKITTIGRYGMSAMKCKIPLGWFYGEVAEIAHVQPSINALNALHQDLTCRFRLATGKLMDLLNPYLELYNGNAAHMMSYLNISNDTDTKVVTAYQECIELQQQLHTCTSMSRKLQNNAEGQRNLPDLIDKGQVSSEALLEAASTDKLRVISETIVDMLLYFYFQVGDVQYEDVNRSWCATVLPLVWEWGGRGAGALATLVARACGAAPWWGAHLADTLTTAFAVYDAPPTSLDKCLVLIIYMSRKSLYSHTTAEGGVCPALASRALDLVRAPRPQPAVTAALLTALASVLDTVAAHSNRHARWDWVTGGRAGGSLPGGEAQGSPRNNECKLHRRKLHKKLLHQMQELEAARRGIQVALEDQQRARLSLKARMAMVGKRGASRGESSGSGASDAARPRPLPAALAARLAHALVAHMLAADTCSHADALMLAAKVVGRLCALSGGASLLDPSCILGLARLAVTLPPWPRHALTTLLQDLVEYESGDSPSSPPNEESWSGAGSSRVIRVHSIPGAPPGVKARKFKGPTVADLLADSFGLGKTTNFKPKLFSTAGVNLANIDVEEQLTQVAESDDSESSEEKLEQYFIDAVKKETRTKLVVDNGSSNVSVCWDARVEAGGGGCGGAGEAAARRALLGTAGALAAAVRAPPPAPPPPPRAPPPPHRPHPPLTHTLYDVFRHLALEFHYQMDCTFMENVISLWLTLNGSAWGSGGAWSLATLAVPADTPRIRLASDTVNALLHSLCTLENISLRCWVLSMQALAWIASLPLQTEGSSTQTMGRVILECEHFVPALVKFITMNVNTDGAVASSEPYLGGAQIGAGAGAASALHSVVSRVVCARGAGGALAALRAVCGVWRRDNDPGHAYDLQATLLRLAHPMLQVLSARHVHHALPLFLTVAHQSVWWVRESVGWRGAGGAGGAGGSEARLPGLLADVLAGGGGAARRAPLRRAVLQQLLSYCRKLLAVPLPPQQLPQNSSSSPSVSTSGEQSQTDESKAQHSSTAEATNVEDERKQQAARTPCFADTVLQHQQIMQKFYRTLSICDGMNTVALNSGMSSEPSSLKEEVFWLVAHMATVASNPALMVTSLMEFLRKEEVVNLSQAMQQLIIRVLDYPEALAAFIDAGGLELALEKLTACHQAGPSSGQGLVSSLMNYLKLPPQMMNMSTPASGNKKSQTPVIETANGLVNIAPLCTVSCGNPTAQAADVLLDGGGGMSVRGACAARRVRAAAWSYHFFSADDASLALTLTLPYAVQLHEVQLQPHLTSLATCPGAVAVEAGCGGTLAPLGPPQNTAGMTFIRLVVARPIVCTTVQIRLYKPRDSSNMGLLQLRLLAAPAFNSHASSTPITSNNWACVVAACTRSGGAAGARLARARGGGAVSALCACVAAGGAPAQHAHAALLAAARHAPALRAPLITALLNMDAHAHAHAFQVSTNGRVNGSMWAVCELVRQLCRWCADGAVAAYVQWLAGAAELWLRQREPPSAALTHTLASVLWTLKEKRILENLEELITDDLFELVYTWVKDVPESSLLKKSLDAILCSMCYIRPELFRMLLEHMDIPMDQDESMEGLTDDTKVQSPSSSSPPAPPARGWQLQTVAAAAMSPGATLALLHSRLPAAVVKAIAGKKVQSPSSSSPPAPPARGWQLQTVAAAAMSPGATLALLHSRLPAAVVKAIAGKKVQSPSSSSPPAPPARGWQLQTVAAAAMSPGATLALLHSRLPAAVVKAIAGKKVQSPSSSSPPAPPARGWQLQTVAAAAMSPGATLALLHSRLPAAVVKAIAGKKVQSPSSSSPPAPPARGWQLQTVAAAAMSPGATLALLHSRLPAAVVKAIAGKKVQSPSSSSPPAPPARGWQLQTVAAAAMSPGATLALLHSRLPAAVVKAIAGKKVQSPSSSSPPAPPARGWQLQTVAAAAMSPGATLALLHSRLPAAVVKAIAGKKVQSPSSSSPPAPPARGWQLQTVAAAAMSPGATLALLHSRLPAAVVKAIAGKKVQSPSSSSPPAPPARGWQLQTVAAAAMSPGATLALLHSRLPAAVVKAIAGKKVQSPSSSSPPAPPARGWQLQTVAAAAMSPGATLALLHSRLPAAVVKAIAGKKVQSPSSSSPPAPPARGWQLQTVAAAAMSPGATLALLHSRLPAAVVKAIAGKKVQSPSSSSPPAPPARGWQLQTVAAAAMSPGATLALLHSRLPAAVVKAIAGKKVQSPSSSSPPAPPARGWQLQTVAAAAMSPGATLALLHSRLPAAVVKAIAGKKVQSPSSSSPPAPPARGWQLQTVAAAAMSPGATLALLHSRLPAAVVKAIAGKKVQSPSSSSPPAPPARGWQLQTVAAAAMSPGATLALLHSRLPAAVVKAIADFSEAKLETIKEQRGSLEDVQMIDPDKETTQPKSDLPSMKSVWQLVEWARAVCWSKRLKDWLGGPGNTFWKPLLTLLCHPRPHYSTWQEDAQYAQLEESTIRLFAELTVCHPANQKLFASTLHSILEGLQCTDGISGFTRALILRLVLSPERVWVSLRWAEGGGAGAGCAHPAYLGHAVLPLPLCSSVRELLAEHRPPLPIMEETTKVCMNTSPTSGGTSVLRSASDTAITTVAEAWELSLAAASASKDKRVKDVKNTSLKQQNNKKRQTKTSNDASVLSVTDDLIETTIRVQVPGLEGFIPPSTTLAQLTAAVPHVFGPHLALTLHLNTNGEAWSGPTWEGAAPASPRAGPSAARAPAAGGSAVLRWFGAVGGLALVAARLPRPHAPPPDPPALVHHHHDLDWVKLDDPYEEVVELGVTTANTGIEESGCTGVPAHALIALGLLLKLPGYADALLDEGARACHLLRLLLGVTHDEDGRSIAVGEGRAGGAGSLGTLPFGVVARLLERAPRSAADGRALRRALLQRGAVRLLLACLAVFTHHRPNSNDNSQGSNGSTGKSEEKSQLYWAKGTGFGTGSTQQSWNVEQALVRQRTEEEHVTVLLQVLASYMNPGEKWPPEEGAAESTDRDGDSDDTHDLPTEFIDLVANSSLVPAICSYLRNDSVLDMSRHIPLYVHVLRCARALHALSSRRLTQALRPLPRLLAMMSRTTNSYATKLRMSKKNIFGKMTYSQRFSTSSNSELSEEDEGLAALIADIQATSALMCRAENEAESGRASGAPQPLSGASREARYIELMRTMQFETFEMIAECAESGFRFLVPYHFEGAVRAAGERAHPARMKRLAQEAATLATSLPLSYSSSVFVRTDADRLDVMKVLITGPSDTPYANGCFVLDVYFPAEYPAVPMLINLETTGRHSVRFNPNLYNDGKVCLSVLNTWHGRPEEKWNAHTSSFLQVLVSIQSLILVPEPYFNEPGYERSRGTRVGSSASLEYNSNIYQACVRWAMLDHLRNPEPCFKEVIQTHFWIKRNEIMQTVANWITELESQSGDERTQRSIQLNLMALKRHYVKLQEELGKLPVPAGLEDLDEPFTLPAAPDAPGPAPPPPTNDEIDHDMEKIVSQVLD